MTDDTLPGEFELIARLTAGLSSHSDVNLGVGDDCAILDIGGDQLLLATCDSQVEDVHFTLHTSSPEQIGRKALAINLSDIASMGGTPRFALVSLILSPDFSLSTLDGIYAGLRQEAERFATTIVGGNIASTGRTVAQAPLTIDITVLGSVARGQALTRSGAQPGDLLCVTGFLGDSAAGLFTLFHPTYPYDPEARDHVQSAHRTPQPRITEGTILSQLGPHIVTAMLDISDGLSGDLSHLCERSRVGAEIDLARLPFSPAIYSIAQTAGQDPAYWALHGGEDYELLFTIRPTFAQQVISAIQAATSTPVTIIGSILPADQQIQFISPTGERASLHSLSWDHLKH